MKYIYILLSMCILLVSCSGAPPDKAIDLAVGGTLTTQPPSTLPPDPSPTRTRIPTSTFTPLPSATHIYTASPSPSATPVVPSDTPALMPVVVKVIILEVNKREEWVDIRNEGEVEVDLTGWNLVSEKGNQGCALAGVIEAGETLRVWSGTAQGEGFSCGYNSPIWNHSESDPAVLYNTEGVEVSRK